MSETTSKSGASNSGSRSTKAASSASKASGSSSKTASKAAPKKTASKKTAAKKSTAKRTTASKSRSKATSTKKTATTANGTAPAVDVPLGVLLGAADQVTRIVSPWTDRQVAEKRVREYRSQLEDSVRRASERGADVRGQAQDRMRKFDAEQLKVLTDRAETLQREFARVLDSQSARAHELVGQVSEQIGARR